MTRHEDEQDTGAPADGALGDEALDSVSGGAPEQGGITQTSSAVLKKPSDTQQPIIGNFK